MVKYARDPVNAAKACKARGSDAVARRMDVPTAAPPLSAPAQHRPMGAHCRGQAGEAVSADSGKGVAGRSDSPIGLGGGSLSSRDLRRHGSGHDGGATQGASATVGGDDDGSRDARSRGVSTRLVSLPLGSGEPGGQGRITWAGMSAEMSAEGSVAQGASAPPASEPSMVAGRHLPIDLPNEVQLLDTTETDRDAPDVPSPPPSTSTSKQSPTSPSSVTTVAADPVPALRLDSPRFLGGLVESARLTAEQMQIQMLIAMGATPLTANGAAGSARHSHQLASFAPLEEAAVSRAWT